MTRGGLRNNRFEQERLINQSFFQSSSFPILKSPSAASSSKFDPKKAGSWNKLELKKKGSWRNLAIKKKSRSVLKLEKTDVLKHRKT